MKSNDDEEHGEAIGPPSEIVYKLKYKWTFWYVPSGDREKSWTDKLTKLFTVGTVQEFWRFYLNVLPPSKLSTGSDYYFFKDGINPTWEDPANESGGRWTYTIDKQERAQKLDNLWVKVLKILICGQFKEMDDLVCGAVVNLRSKSDKVVLWTNKECGSNAEAIRHIEDLFITNLGLSPTQVRYEPHPSPEKPAVKVDPPPVEVLVSP
ncbi:EIF-4F 25 kDa subunit [Aphelenchoides bicaudatus]|nr:EIF-4F 25 kDa subunit [Aphelenchoides bicaudatus]